MLVRGDTPPTMLAELHDAGVTSRTQLVQVKGVLDQDAYALSLNLYLVAALAAIVLAGAGLAVTLAVQMPDRRRDAASMRVVGVRRRQIMRAVFVEIMRRAWRAGLAGILAGSTSRYIVLRLTSFVRTPHARVRPTSCATTVASCRDPATSRRVATMAVARARAVALCSSPRPRWCLPRYASAGGSASSGQIAVDGESPVGALTAPTVWPWRARTRFRSTRSRRPRGNGGAVGGRRRDARRDQPDAGAAAGARRARRDPAAARADLRPLRGAGAAHVLASGCCRWARWATGCRCTRPR